MTFRFSWSECLTLRVSLLVWLSAFSLYVCLLVGSRFETLLGESLGAGWAPWGLHGLPKGPQGVPKKDPNMVQNGVSKSTPFSEGGPPGTPKGPQSELKWTPTWIQNDE